MTGRAAITALDCDFDGQELPEDRTEARWPRRIGLLNDYLRIPYANGSSFASQFLYRELGRRGVDVTVLGPSDPATKPGELPRQHVAFPSLPLRNHPGVRVPMPARPRSTRWAAKGFDLTLARPAAPSSIWGPGCVLGKAFLSCASTPCTCPASTTWCCPIRSGRTTRRSA
jgi:hypothetical protein